MAMSLRVVVPPHPLISHWLAVLRDQHTPQPLYGSAMTELGRWLTYEAIRDWLPHRPLSLTTDLAATEGQIIDNTVPLLALPLLSDGLGLWNGGQTVLPSALVAHPQLAAHGAVDGLPPTIGTATGVMVFCGQVATGERLARLLEGLEAAGVSGRRLRVVTALTASPGLQRLGERFPELTLYTACIDPEVSGDGRVVPGIGQLQERLFGWRTVETPAVTA